LKPKAADKELMKALPPPEDDVDPDGAVTTIVEDSDDEHEIEAPVPSPEPVSVPVPSPSPSPVVEPVPSPIVEEVKPKKKIVRKTG
jgi:hypothetical protein